MVVNKTRHSLISVVRGQPQKGYRDHVDISGSARQCDTQEYATMGVGNHRGESNITGTTRNPYYTGIRTEPVGILCEA